MIAHFTLEICAGDIRSVIAAREGGASRVELCSALALGGLTPSEGLIRQAVELGGMPVNVLIRPREGDFVYSSAEIDCMLDDIDTARRLGASGVVVGALRPDNTLDEGTCRRLIQAARGMTVTLHRCFDLTLDLEDSLERAIALGFDTVLTSGGAPSAIEGTEAIRSLVNIARGRIDILAGAGVKSDNVSRLVLMSGVTSVHSSARVAAYTSQPAVTVRMGDADTGSHLSSDTQEIKQIIKALNSI